MLITSAPICLFQPADCRDFIQQLTSCAEGELLVRLRDEEKPLGQRQSIQLIEWASVLDRFDSILKKAWTCDLDEEVMVAGLLSFQS